MKKTVLTAIAICFFAMAGLSFAAGPYWDCPMKSGDGSGMGMGMKMMRGGHHGMGHGNMGKGMLRGKWWKNPDLAKVANLTDEELTKLDSLFAEHRKLTIDLKGAVGKAKIDLSQTMQAKIFDENAATAQFQKLQEAKSNLAGEKFRFRVEVRKLLGNERCLKIKSEAQKIGRPMRGQDAPAGKGMMMKGMQQRNY